MSQPIQHGSREVLREGADEVKEKLREDLSRWTRARQYVTLAPTIPCEECEGTGQLLCSDCRGSGKARMSYGDETQACPTCNGTAHVTCAVCAGRKIVANPHRKKLRTLLIVGGVAWALVLLRLWALDHDILPGFRASGGGAPLHSGGGHTTRPNGGMSPTPGIDPSTRGR